MTSKDPFAHLPFSQRLIRVMGIMAVPGVLVLIYLLSSGGSTQKPSSEAVQTAKADASETRFIPGLSPPDVYLNFKQKGFDCGKIQVTMVEGKSNNSWTCQDETAEHSYMVQVFGEGDVRNVQSVQATSLNFGRGDSNAVAKSFLGFAASIPYEGATPQDARDWVEKNVGKNTERAFSGVKYELVSNARARILTVSMPSDVSTTTSAMTK